MADCRFGGRAGEPARVAGRGRLRTVRADFFLEPAERLTEQERALMTAMLRCLVGDIASEIRAALPSGWAGANDDDAAMVNRWRAPGLLDDAGLIALLLRRADEERIGTAARSRTGRGDARAIQGLVSHPNAEVSAAAMGADPRARAAQGSLRPVPAVAFDDLSRETAERLVHAIAAALRNSFARRMAMPLPTGSSVELRQSLVAKHDRARSIESLTASLVAALHQSGSLTDELLLASAREGEIAFLCEALGRRADIPAMWRWTSFSRAIRARLIAVLRLAELSRQLSAALLASVGDLFGIEDRGRRDRTLRCRDRREIQAAASWLASPARYRAAWIASERRNG